MPAWSPEIAYELIKLASEDGKAFNQMQLQDLVYIAHGWCLAISGQPLTGDRPEAADHGPEYRRLAEALSYCGLNPVTAINFGTAVMKISGMDATLLSATELSAFERKVLGRIYTDYGGLDIKHLSIVTRSKGTPWDEIHAGGTGRNRDIPHNLIKAQFADVAARIIG